MLNNLDFLRTPFHSDVFGSFSWSSNIYGRKHWFLLPPGEEFKLKDSFGRLPFSISKELLDVKNVKYFDFIQECNQTLFVPSKWFHQVKNETDAVSINHNWFNGCCCEQVTLSLLNHFKEVENEISDCRDMENFDDHCQLMLKTSFGMDFSSYVDILEHIAEKRIKSLQNGLKIKIFEKFVFGKNHTIYDLNQILKNLTQLSENQSVVKYEKILKRICDLIEKIKTFFNL